MASAEFEAALRAAPADGHLRALIGRGFFLGGDPVFDDLVCFTLAGIASRRDEALPEALDRSGPPEPNPLLHGWNRDDQEDR